VLEVVSDRKLGQLLYSYSAVSSGTHVYNAQSNEYIYVGTGGNFNQSGSTTEVNYDLYLPEVMSYSDYYPFHMQMPNRHSGSYRYLGANGQESESEITGDNSHSSAEYWMYDNRLGRRWNIDPVDQISVSNYSAFLNNPLYYSDPFGNDPPEKKSHVVKDGETVWSIAKNMSRADASNEEINNMKNDLLKWNNLTEESAKTIQAGQELYTNDMSRWSQVKENGFTYWKDKENPEEWWVGSEDNGWVDINSQTYVNWFAEQWEKPIGYIDEWGEETAMKYDSRAEAMMMLAPLFIDWASILYSPNVRGSKSSRLFRGGKTSVNLKAKTTTVKPTELNATHSVNTKGSRYKTLLKSISDEGIKEPIKYVTCNGKKYVVDGHHRLRAAKELKLNSVPVQEVKLPYLGYKTEWDLIFGN